MHGLRRGYRGVGIAHGRRRDAAELQHEIGLDAEERGRPNHEIGEFADLDRPEVAADALRDRGIDGVFGDVALGAVVVVVAGLLGEPATLALHLVGSLPRPDDHLADPAHGLAVG